MYQHDHHHYYYRHHCLMIDQTIQNCIRRQSSTLSSLGCSHEFCLCWHFEDQVRRCEEDSRIRHCHSLKSGRTFDAWSEFVSFRHVEEVVSCGTIGNPVGQLGDPLSRIQAAGIYLKSCLGLYLA